WTATVDDYKKGYYMSLAPLVIDGKVLLGASGGELGVRGFLAAFDAETGKELWKTYTVPAPGEPGSETWPAGGDHYKRGGASIWITGTYDPETNLTFWAPATAARGSAISAPATISTPARLSPSTPPAARSKATSNITPTIPGIGTKSRPDCPRLSAQWKNREGPRERRARRLPLAARAHQRQDQLHRRPTLRAPERLQKSRSQNRSAGNR